MLKEDLPKDEFAWWQWLLCGIAFLATLVSVDVTSFSFTNLGLASLGSMSQAQLMSTAAKTVPQGLIIFSTVAAQEVARRIVASQYGVKFTPPFFIPVFPFPSVGCLGAVSRRMSTVPSEDANLAMSTAAPIAGLLVSILAILFGLSQGPDPDNIISLNFQMLPAALKLVLQPFLGEGVIPNQPDPYGVNLLLYPSNAYTVGGIVGFVITCLNLLPIGRLDGGIIAKSALGNRDGRLLGLIGTLFILVAAFVSPGEQSFLYASFGFYSGIFQGGAENPPRDAITEPSQGLKAFALSLAVLGSILVVPGGGMLGGGIPGGGIPPGV
eukprot:TRINITY_DN27105_c0_g1_i1.p1 TRINITY_DN27105_c0_g1~~TRINITY_DN27105_c0_g1_i1.p1  ORF type:complete len:325 (+),score=43.41 TRINITY_DN27105_c0_g1_i1:373-1347(+)